MRTKASGEGAKPGKEECPKQSGERTLQGVKGPKILQAKSLSPALVPKSEEKPLEGFEQVHTEFNLY